METETEKLEETAKIISGTFFIFVFSILIGLIVNNLLLGVIFGLGINCIIIISLILLMFEEEEE